MCLFFHRQRFVVVHEEVLPHLLHTRQTGGDDFGLSGVVAVLLSASGGDVVKDVLLLGLEGFALELYVEGVDEGQGKFLLVDGSVYVGQLRTPVAQVEAGLLQVLRIVHDIHGTLIDCVLVHDAGHEQTGHFALQRVLLHDFGKTFRSVDGDIGIAARKLHTQDAAGDGLHQGVVAREPQGLLAQVDVAGHLCLLDAEEARIDGGHAECLVLKGPRADGLPVGLCLYVACRQQAE